MPGDTLDDASNDASHDASNRAGHDADDGAGDRVPAMVRATDRAGTNGTTIAVVLAAGAGTRFHGDHHKLDSRVAGRTLAEHAIAAALASRLTPVVVVTGANRPVLTGALLDAQHAGTVLMVHNPHWSEGQSTSLQVGIAVAGDLGADAVVVGLADQPFVPPATWRAVATSTSPIAVATYEGRPRNPVRLHRSVWADLPDHGDTGARMLIRLRPDLVEQIPSPGSPADIDTLEDLRTWQSRSSTNSP